MRKTADTSTQFPLDWVGHLTRFQYVINPAPVYLSMYQGQLRTPCPVVMSDCGTSGWCAWVYAGLYHPSSIVLQPLSDSRSTNLVYAHVILASQHPTTRWNS